MSVVQRTAGDLSVRSTRWRGGYTNKLRATHKAVCNPKVWLFNAAVNPSRFELSLDRLRVAEIQLDAPYKSEPGEARVLPSLEYRLTILLLSLPARKLSVNRLNPDVNASPSSPCWKTLRHLVRIRSISYFPTVRIQFHNWCVYWRTWDYCQELLVSYFSRGKNTYRKVSLKTSKNITWKLSYRNFFYFFFVFRISRDFFKERN